MIGLINWHTVCGVTYLNNYDFLCLYKPAFPLFGHSKQRRPRCPISLKEFPIGFSYDQELDKE